MSGDVEKCLEMSKDVEKCQEMSSIKFRKMLDMSKTSEDVYRDVGDVGRCCGKVRVEIKEGYKE